MNSGAYSTEYEIGGRKCHIYGSENADICIICGMGNHVKGEIESTAKLLYNRASSDNCKLIIFESADWNGDFSPSRASAVYGKEDFSGNAPRTLDWIESSLLLSLQDKRILKPNDKIYLAGYSLSGLFSLWSFLKSDVFSGAACCSGSLWFPGWAEYMSNQKISRDGIVYLSLGSKEENTNNRALAAVGDNTRNAYRILKESPHIKEVTLEWNKGGHFANPTERLVKGMLWLIRAGNEYN